MAAGGEVVGAGESGEVVSDVAAVASTAAAANEEESPPKGKSID